MITIELESAVGPRVVVSGTVDPQEVESALPEGWTVDWESAARTAFGDQSFPLIPDRELTEDLAQCVEGLQWAAQACGEDTIVELCRQALDGDQSALAECVRLIEVAESCNRGSN